MFPSIEHKKKASLGTQKQIRSPGHIRSNFYNPNKVTHYKQDYLKMVQKEADKKINEAIRYSSPLKNIKQHPKIDFMKSNNVNDVSKINNAIAI